MKKLLTILLTLFLFSSVYADEQKTTYYPTGEVEEVEEHVAGEKSKVTTYYKTGRVKQDQEYVNGKRSKVTNYYPTSEVKKVYKFVDDEVLKATIFHKTGEVKEIDEYVNGKHSKATQYYKTGEIQTIQEFFNGNSKATFYNKTGEVDRILEFTDGKKSKETFYNKTGKVEQIQEYVDKPHITITKTVKELNLGKDYLRLFLFIFFIASVLAIYIYYCRDSKDALGKKLLWGFTTFYIMGWLYPLAAPSNDNMIGWGWFMIGYLTPLLIGSWVIYSISRSFKKRFKKR